MPLHSAAQYETWARVFTAEFKRLVRCAEQGLFCYLNDYGATNPAEFFAVVTEYFFDDPVVLRRRHRALYDVLRGFYNQDTAARQLTCAMRKR